MSNANIQINLSKTPRYPREVAEYTEYPMNRYRRNPFAECLKVSHYSKDSLYKSFAKAPPEPTAADRTQSDFLRELELDNVRSIVYARPAYRAAATLILRAVMCPYALYNPLEVEAVALRHDLAAMETHDVFKDAKLLKPSESFDLAWRGEAFGIGIVGCTGSGKSTLLRAIEGLLARVIKHETYGSYQLGHTQIPVLKVSVPHDATIRAFILQFAALVDHHLRQHLYEPQVRGLKTIGDAALLMLRICAAINLGGLIVDDLQNLRVARGPNVEVALNLLSLLIDFGTSVIAAATPALGPIIVHNARNTRKLFSGQVHLKMMPPGSAESSAFQDLFWKYRYTTGEDVVLSPTIRGAWEKAGAGNPAFSALAWSLVQARLIGEEDETITEDVFSHVAHIDMAVLKPAIDALNSNDALQLQHFDDLVFTTEIERLLERVGMERSDPSDENPFDDEPECDAPKAPKSQKSKSGGPNLRRKRLPTEDPVSLMALR